MLKRLEQGGEVAQGVVRELFPGGITRRSWVRDLRHFGALGVTPSY